MSGAPGLCEEHTPAVQGSYLKRDVENIQIYGARFVFQVGTRHIIISLLVRTKYLLFHYVFYWKTKGLGKGR